MQVVVVFPQVAEAIRQYQQGQEPGRNVHLLSVTASQLDYGLDEVMQLVNLLGAKLLTGKEATIHGLLTILAEPCDILWVITHGTQDGWFLADGIVTASELTSLVRSAGIFLTVLNTCESEEVARQVSRELGTALLCTISPVPDRQAFITGVLFARHLSRGLDYVDAWTLAKPGQKHPYVLIEAEDQEEYPMNQRDREAKEHSTAVLDRLTKTVEDLDLLVNGNARFKVPGLVSSLDQISTEVASLKKDWNESSQIIKEELTTIKQRQGLRNTLVIGMSVIILLLLLLSGVLVQQLVLIGGIGT